MQNRDVELNDLFREYREACSEVEPHANFMPVLWQKIEARQNFFSVFERFGRTMAAASAALCLLLLVLNVFSPPTVRSVAPSYADALMADHTAEKTYYAEAIRSNSTPLEPSERLQR
ncbi:MAG: hypothetical protein M3Y24_03440 [Acidobacteriota bacterium]|nr:hypothetical protein [Acidobacteriota bacterium]